MGDLSFMQKFVVLGVRVVQMGAAAVALYPLYLLTQPQATMVGLDGQPTASWVQKLLACGFCVACIAVAEGLGRFAKLPIWRGRR